MPPRRHSYSLSIAGRVYPVRSRSRLIRRLRRARQQCYLDIWLNRSDGVALALLANAGRALLLFTRHDGDTGFSSRSASGASADPHLQGTWIEFRLSNGRHEYFPAAYCVTIQMAMDALVYFYTCGGRAPWVIWHDDSEPDTRPLYGAN